MKYELKHLENPFQTVCPKNLKCREKAGNPISNETKIFLNLIDIKENVFSLKECQFFNEPQYS